MDEVSYTSAADSGSKQSVALWSIAASGSLAALKLAAGLLTGSIGILSEAAHSLLDCGGTVLTYLAVRMSDRPADQNHPYGHGKIESVAALAEMGLLFSTSAWIIYVAVHRLAFGGEDIRPSWWAVGVMVLSILVDWARARQLDRVAKATRSHALAADALHFRADILSSGVVILGLGAVALGYPMADSIAALGVSIFVCLAGYRLGRETIHTLTDAAPEGVAETVADLTRSIPGVARVESVRGAQRGSALHVDLEVAVGRTLPRERVSDIKAEIAAEVRSRLPQTLVRVETHPLALDDETISDQVQLIAANQGVPVHHVTVQHVDEVISVSFDVEVDGRQPIGEAHQTATRLEKAIRAELGSEIEVETHIEPLLTDTVAASHLSWARYRALRDQIEQLADQTPGLIDAHDIRIRQTTRGLFISLHCHVPPEHTVEIAHDAVSQLENRIREQVPDTRRIIVHSEPLIETVALAAE